MGHTRLSERKEFLFVRTDRRDAKASSTGGCAIERRNWYLSNVGILGFGHMRHCILGTIGILHLFDVPEVWNYLMENGWKGA